MKPRDVILLGGLSLSVLAGCRQQQPPVARLEVEPRSVTLGYPNTARLDARFEPLAPHPSDSFRVFVHLLSERGELLRTFDYELTAAWKVGQPVGSGIELWQSALGPFLAPGRYRLSLGIYDRDGHRWPLAVDGAEIDDHEYAVATVEVPPPEGAAPMAFFSESWRPTWFGGSRQTLAVRWLAGDGTIELRGLRRPVVVGLTVGITRQPEGRYRLVLDEAAERPEVTVRSACSQRPVRRSDYGRHEIELTLSPAAESSSCGIEIDPNFVHLELDALNKSSVVLERLVWDEVETSALAELSDQDSRPQGTTGG